MRISLGILTYSDIHLETAMSLMYLLQASPYEFHLNFHKGTYVHQLRNDIVKDALENNADYLFFVDSDVIFPPDGLNKLLSADKDIIGGMYNMKSLPPINTIKMADKDGNCIEADGAKLPKDKIFRCHAVPTGFMLIKLEAIKDMVNPFDFGRNDKGELIGEDINFCKRCQKMGLEIWCDPTINIGHIGSYVY